MRCAIGSREDVEVSASGKASVKRKERCATGWVRTGGCEGMGVRECGVAGCVRVRARGEQEGQGRDHRGA
eukprot:353079-Chlamydomonas_euryale.AAC.4